MNNYNKILLAFGLTTVALGLTGCPTDPMPTDTPGADVPRSDTPGADVPMGTDTGGVVTQDCAGYCGQITAACTGANAQYDDMAQCMAYCTAVAWPAGTPGEAGNNTLACRIYHGGVAVMDPAMHCPHSGPTGAGVCGASITFRTDLAATYTRVDRMGMPAVATALVPTDSRNAYNDGDPSDDAALTFAGAALGTLTAIHTGLDDDLTAAGLTPCSMTMTRMLPGIPIPVPLCAAQSVGTGGPPVVSLVVPDTLTVNPAAMSGFPNGRDLDDRVIDVTLAIILLDIEGTTGCGGTGCTAGTLTGLSMGRGLNPAANDRPFGTTFPYLAPLHAAP